MRRRKDRAARRSLQELALEFISKLPGDVDADRIAAALDKVTAEGAEELYQGLLRRMPKMLRGYAKDTNRFQRRLRTRWGVALDLHYAAVVAARELGELLLERAGRDTHTALDDAACDVLADLHAQACRVALEVHHLLQGGYTVAAHARARTAHELAVTAIVIGENAESSDVVERYRVHHVIDRAKDAATYQRYCAQIGYKPFSDKEMAAIEADRQEAVDRFGKSFDQQYGWAAELLHKARPSFVDIEAHVQLDHLRPFYRWACHGVHAGSRGAVLNTVLAGSEAVRLAGATNFGLADPGHGVLISMYQVTAAFMARSTSTATADDIVMTLGIDRLVDAAGNAYLAAHHAVAGTND